MELNPDYYGSEDLSKLERISCLKFGSMDVKTNVIHGWGNTLWGQEAYDYYMLPRYTQDLLHFREILETTGVNISMLSFKVGLTAHKDFANLLLKYASVLHAQSRGYSEGRLKLFELGHTIFGLIDEILAVDKAINQENASQYIEEGLFVGCEISDMMNRVSKAFHPNNKFELYLESKASDFLGQNPEYDIFYCFGITFQYALRTSQDLVDLCKRAKLSVLSRLQVSLGETEMVGMGTGKFGYNVSLSEFLDKLTNEHGLSAIFLPEKTLLFPPEHHVGVFWCKNKFPGMDTVLMVGKQDELDHFSDMHKDLCKKVELALGKTVEGLYSNWQPIEKLEEAIKSYSP